VHSIIDVERSFGGRKRFKAIGDLPPTREHAHR
jgi:hypothetical protein